jgi:hypothetical protein
MDPDPILLLYAYGFGSRSVSRLCQALAAYRQSRHQCKRRCFYSFFLSGSVRSSKFLDLPDPSFFVRIRILPSSSKIKVRKTLISTVSWLLFNFLSLRLIKICLHHKVISIKLRKNTIFLVGILKAADEKSGSEADSCPSISVTDPRSRICTQMSRFFFTRVNVPELFFIRI